MNTISIHLPDALARSYEHADQKKKAEQYINAWLSYFLNNKSSDDAISEISRQTSEIARKTGLYRKHSSNC